MKLPQVVSAHEWEAALEKQHAKEKAATRASDAPNEWWRRHDEYEEGQR